MHDYWVKQTADKPLFEDLLWSRPETKRTAGKLLVVGGNAQGFAAAAEAYAEADKAGIGTARVLLPDGLKKTVGQIFEVGEYAPSTPSGSFAKSALSELQAMASWADGVLLAGDLGRNSETAVLLEQFVKDYQGRLTITKDAADYFLKQPAAMLDRADTCLVVSFGQLQKIASAGGFTPAFKFGMDFLHLVEALHEFTQKHQAAIIVKHLETIFVAAGGKVSTTKLAEDQKIWRLKTASHAAVWWLQNPDKPFEAITTSLIEP